MYCLFLMAAALLREAAVADGQHTGRTEILKKTISQ